MSIGTNELFIFSGVVLVVVVALGLYAIRKRNG
jgi:hypothetical protein